MRFKTYSFINLLGLTAGLTLTVLIMLFVIDEMEYDRFHKKSDRIYKVVSRNQRGEFLEHNSWPAAHILKTTYPEVESVVYARRAGRAMTLNADGKRYTHDVFYAGEDFFHIFSFDFMKGESEKALKDPFSIVITEEIKHRYFGDKQAIGQTLTLRDSLVFTVTGVLRDLPTQSHIQFDMLLSFSTFERLKRDFSYSQGWGNFNVINYLLLEEGASLESIRSKASDLYMENNGEWFKEIGSSMYLSFIPLNEIYLVSDIANSFGPKGSLNRIYMVSVIAAFVLVLACINFINLTTARSIYRAKEVGLRKSLGASRTSMFWLFMTETLLLTLASFFIVILFIDFSLPFFNALMGKFYTLYSLLNFRTLAGSIIVITTVTFMAGFYPAMVLSGMNPVNVLKGQVRAGLTGSNLRRVLVIFQFFISAGLLLATIIVLDQMAYMKHKNLGFQKEQVLVLDAIRVPRSAADQVFKNSLQTLSGVDDVTFTNALPGSPGWQGQWAYPERISEGTQVVTEYMAIDENYLPTLELELLAGNNFDPAHLRWLNEGLIINETTVRDMGWGTPENAIGKKIVSPSGSPEGTVIGVVKDYHGVGLQESIWPKAMGYTSVWHGRYYAVRFSSNQISAFLNDVEALWKKDLGDYDFEYFFLDENFEKQYRAEERLTQILTIFSLLSLLISGIGLLGLVSFMVLFRTKEIGIRKVLGAGIASIAGLLTKEFIVLILIANAIVIPLVWYFGNEWLNRFAYHEDVDPSIFMITLFVTLLASVMTVSIHTLRAGLMNPATILRNE